MEGDKVGVSTYESQWQKVELRLNVADWSGTVSDELPEAEQPNKIRGIFLIAYRYTLQFGCGVSG